MAIDGGNQQVIADSVPFARSYQLEALEKALKQNTIVFLETGTGKTLIAIMLLRSYAHLLRKPSPFIAVFLVPTVVLVTQQAEAVAILTDLKVGKYYGELGVDYWDAATWNLQKDENEVLVMTPQILLDALRHSFLKLDQIKVLIFDECHNARGKHPYARIMMEFYHRELSSNNLQLPRVFGMTASPIKAKASSSESAYWNQIRELENLMNSKVYTCDTDSVLARYVPFATPKVKTYKQVDVPYMAFDCIKSDLYKLTEKHEHSLNGSSISISVSKSAKKRLHKLLSTFMYCLDELGSWLAMKAAEVLLHEEGDIFSWGKLDVSDNAILRAFSLDAVKVFSAIFPDGPQWSIGSNVIANMKAGYITSKVMCLVETILEYREVKELRCIVFVERIVSAIVICNLLNELLPGLSGWRTEYTAGNNSRFQNQSRKEQNKIVDEFRKGMVNIIITTSMLEEGLDVQSCNLVIRFDPSSTVCSFIQSRGRARMQDSDFVLMVESGNMYALAQVKKYLASGTIIRSECLSHSALPCERLGEMYGEACYEVKSTGAIVTLSSSVSLLYFYCSRLPSDGYFKPYPRWSIDKELGSCTLLLPNSCPIQIVEVQGDGKLLKQLAGLEACKQLHLLGELTDNLVPKILEEEADTEESGGECNVDEHTKYFPPELINSRGNGDAVYYCYLIELKQSFQYEVQLQEIVLAVPTRLGYDLEMIDLDLDVDRGKLLVHIKYMEDIILTSEQIAQCRRFQTILFRILLDHNVNNLQVHLGLYSGRKDCTEFDYLLLPCADMHQNVNIDWRCVSAVQYLNNGSFDMQAECISTKCHGHHLHTNNGLVCICMLENSLVCTPHNGSIYCITGTLDGYDGNSNLELRDGKVLSYKSYFEKRHGIKLQFEGQILLRGKRIFTIQNCLQRCRTPKTKESSNSSVELPPELCSIIMSPLSISTLYSFSFLPSIMHRIESLLMAANLKSIHADSSVKDVFIPTVTVLEAITTKKCQEKIHLESLETLGDSFLKYAVSQQLFKIHQNHHEGLLSIKRQKKVSNANLCKLGCARNIAGFIRNEPFDPKTWIIPGSSSTEYKLKEELILSKKVYSWGSRKLKSKRIADVVEALIGAFLSAGSEIAALSFMVWLGIDVVDFTNVPYSRNLPANPEFHVNVKYFESLLKYSFLDVSLLVEALTHGSYMLPEIPRCYQRLEFLGDAVLDYLITADLYGKYPGLSPGLLTDLRSASTNNDFYAQSAVKLGLYKHILYASQDLHRHIVDTIHNFEQLSSFPTNWWESETRFPKVLGDVIESLAGAILVDSGYNMQIVFQCMRPLLDPMITLDSLRPHPVRELNELCQNKHYIFKKIPVSHQNGVAYFTVEVKANGIVHKHSSSAADKKKAKLKACKNVLNSIKESRIP